MLDLFHSDRIQAHIKCPCCDERMTDDEDLIEINGRIFHTVCIEEINGIELLQMFGIEVKEVN